MSHSRNERRVSTAFQQVARLRRYHADKQLDQDIPRRSHAFVIFRIGMDACAKCRKSRSEHT